MYVHIYVTITICWILKIDLELASTKCILVDDKELHVGWSDFVHFWPAHPSWETEFKEEMRAENFIYWQQVLL